MPTQKQPKHSILSASSCERWWNCPGSVRLCKNIPSSPNKYTAGGTVAHMLAEWALRTNGNLEDQIGTLRIQDGFEIEVTEEMIDAIIEYVQYVRKIIVEIGPRATVKLEEKIELTEVNAILFGQPDCIVVNPFQTVHVFDLKFGEGKRVSAWQNKQLLYYVLGVMLKEDCTKFVLHICQPRVENGFTTFTGTADDIIEFQHELKTHVEAALDPKAELIPGDHCRETFCPARTTCPALQNLTKSLTIKDFNCPPVIELLPIEHITKILMYEETIKDWMARVRDHAKELMIQGTPVPGFKLVQGLGHSQWLDPEVIVAEFGDEFGEKLYEKKLLSPSKFEKAVGKRRLGPDFREKYTFRPTTDFKIVGESEKGEPVKILKPQEDFQ